MLDLFTQENWDSCSPLDTGHDDYHGDIDETAIEETEDEQGAEIKPR